jgi:hypothetical protein
MEQQGKRKLKLTRKFIMNNTTSFIETAAATADIMDAMINHVIKRAEKPSIKETLEARRIDRPRTFDQAAVTWLFTESAKSHFFNLVFQGCQILKDRNTKAGRACRDLQEANDESELLGMVLFAEETRLANSTGDAICQAAFAAFRANRRNPEQDTDSEEASCKDTQFWVYQALNLRELSKTSPDLESIKAPILYWENTGLDEFRPHREFEDAMYAAETAAANWKMEQQRIEAAASSKRKGILEQMRSK